MYNYKITKKYQLGEYGPRFPSISEKSLAKVLRALIEVRGKLLDSYYQTDYSNRNILYLIEIPVGSENEFEEKTGYTLSECYEMGVT